MRIKIRKADSLYSQYLRKKIPYCERCGLTETLQVSHFWGRRNESTRFDPQNTDILCFSCHRHFTENPADYREWKLKKLGEREYKILDVRAHSYQKRDDNQIILWIMSQDKQIDRG